MLHTKCLTPTIQATIWTKMAKKTFHAIRECAAPGFKAANDRTSLLLYTHATSDMKVKLMLIYSSQNRRGLKDKDKKVACFMVTK